jgi:hypothetical protein
MFDDLFTLEKQRTTEQAIGFYLAYLLFTILVAAIIGGLIMQDIEGSVLIGLRAAAIFCLALSFLILYKKNQFNLPMVLIALSSGLAAMVLGSLLGLVPVAYLTTRKKAAK